MTVGLVLAGTRRGGDPFAAANQVSHKSLIDVGGRPMLERVIVALFKAGMEQVAVSTNDGAVAGIARKLGALVIEAADGPSASVAAALARFGTPMLVTTGDHALLRSEWVREMVRDTPDAADVGIMMAHQDRVEAAMPGTKRTYLAFADGRWSGCNLFYLKTARAEAAIDLWQMVEADRKRPWRVAARLGPATLLSMVLRRLTLADGIARLGQRIGIDAAMVPATDGLAAVDVDKPADLIAVRQIVNQS